MAVNKQHIVKVLIGSFWGALGAAVLVLLIAAMHKKNAAKCNGVDVEIRGVSTNFFIDEADIIGLIQREAGGKMEGRPVEKFNLKKLETGLENDVWIKHAELFFDNNGILKAIIDEREPVARIFSATGATFYVDSSNMILPLSEKFSARLPLFTNFPADTKVLKIADSLLLNNINNLAQIIMADSFLMGMIEQVDIAAGNSFEIIPKIGKQVIEFGDANNAGEKFNKLKLFYKNIMLKAGWNRYSNINLQYKDQVVAKLRNKEDVIADSLRTLQLLKLMADKAEAMASDSSLAGQSADGNNEQIGTNNVVQQNITPGNINSITSEPTKPLVKPAKPALKPVPMKTKPLEKPIIKPPGNTINKIDSGKKPKAVMPGNH